MIGWTAVALAATLAQLSPMDTGDPWGDFSGFTGSGSWVVDGVRGGDSSTTHPASNTSAPSAHPDQYARAAQCGTAQVRSDLSIACPGGNEIVVTCLDGGDAQLPWWRRQWVGPGDADYGDWAMVQSYTCPGDAPLLAAIQHEWTELRPQPSDIALQPNTGWVLATVPTVAMANDEPRAHAAVLLGANVDIRATASGYRWVWGDGSHTLTDDPGHPFPNATVTHTYPHASDAATVQLTTTWSGEFRVNGGPWQPFTTTITSDSTPFALTIYDPRSRLVDCSIDGQCHLAKTG